MNTLRPSHGFSLIEVIMVIVISGIVAVMLVTIVQSPMQGIDATIRRAELVDMAESALRRMQRDIRASLPNSVRVRSSGGASGSVSCPANGTVCAVEILHAADGGRYRANLPGDRLLFDGTDTQFDVIGTLRAAPTAGHYLVVGNQASTGSEFNAYNCQPAAGSHNCVPLAGGSTTSHLVMVAAFSPTTPTLATVGQRFFVVDTPVTYLCDTAAGTLTRYSGYTITANHANISSNAQLLAAGATAAVSTNFVASCGFTYQSGTSARAGLVTLDLTIQDTAHATDRVRLLHQVHVYNVP